MDNEGSTRAPAPSLTIVIPAYNEQSRIGSTIEHLAAAWREAHPGEATGSGDGLEILVSDDGSVDSTAATVQAHRGSHPNVRLIRSDRNRGKGAALRLCIDSALGYILVLLDADLPIPFHEILALADAASSADLVLGTRLSNSGVTAAQPVGRRIGGWLFRSAVRALGYHRASDPQCGAKALRRATVGPVLESVTAAGYAFDVELIERCARRGLTVVERPVTWRHTPGSRVRPVRDALTTLGTLARLRSTFR